MPRNWFREICREEDAFEFHKEENTHETDNNHSSVSSLGRRDSPGDRYHNVEACRARGLRREWMLERTLNSNYSFIQPAGFTTHNSTTGNEVPWQFVGVETFDGKDKTTVSYTAAVDGAISQNQAAAGTYTVNSNCTGSLSFTEGDAAGLTFDIAISGGGAEVFAISTNSGDTATVVEKKQ